MPLATARIVSDGPASWASGELKRTYVKGREYFVESERELDILKGMWCFDVHETTLVLDSVEPEIDEPDVEPVDSGVLDEEPVVLSRRPKNKRGKP